jgi:hypothetical protein
MGVLDEITRVLSPLVGASIQRVVYRPLPGEVAPSALIDVPMYIGGEVQIQMGERPPLFIGWNEDERRNEHFYLVVSSEPTFNPGALDDVEATDFPLWVIHAGQPLREWRVLGLGGDPHVLALTFETGTVYLGTGSEGEFGDADDVVVSDRLNGPPSGDWVELAFSAKTER